MQRILYRKMLRELRSGALRYLALGLMITFSMYLIVSLLGAADTVILGTAEHAEKNLLEDGQFTVFVPLTDRELADISAQGVDVEPMFFLDYEMENGSVIRVFRIRQKMDLAEAEDGGLPETDDGIALERRYCEVNGIRVGDRITLAGESLTVSGIVSTPDYDAPFRAMGKRWRRSGPSCRTHCIRRSRTCGKPGKHWRTDPVRCGTRSRKSQTRI